MSQKSPLDTLIDKSVRCVICGQTEPLCTCWVRCSCGWTYLKGQQCRSPHHWQQSDDDTWMCEKHGKSIVLTLINGYWAYDIDGEVGPVGYLDLDKAKEVSEWEAYRFTISCVCSKPRDTGRACGSARNLKTSCRCACHKRKR